MRSREAIIELIGSKLDWAQSRECHHPRGPLSEAYGLSQALGDRRLEQEVFDLMLLSIRQAPELSLEIDRFRRHWVAETEWWGIARRDARTTERPGGGTP